MATRNHRRYTRQEKAEAVAEVTRTSLTATSERRKVAINTLKYWYDHEDFADVRNKTREELAEGSVAMALIAQGELVRRIRSGDISDQALVAAYGVGIDKGQLLSGRATERTESHEWRIDDYETVERANAVLLEELGRRADERVAEATVGPAGKARAEGTAR